MGGTRVGTLSCGRNLAAPTALFHPRLNAPTLGTKLRPCPELRRSDLPIRARLGAVIKRLSTLTFYWGVGGRVPSLLVSLIPFYLPASNIVLNLVLGYTKP